MNILAGCRTLQDFVDRSMVLFGNPMIVFDDRSHVVACTEIEIEDEQFDHLRRNRIPSSMLTEDFDWRKKMAELRRATTAYKDAYIGVTHIAKPITVNKRYVGQIDIAEHFRALTEGDIAVAELIAYPIGAFLIEATALRRPRNYKLDYILEYLLDGNTLTEEAVSMHAQTVGWTFGSINYVLVNEAFVPGPETQDVRFDGLLSRSDKLVRYRNYLIAVLSRADDLSEADILRLEAGLARRGLVCGLSRPFPNMSHIADHFQEATRALDIGQRVDGERHLYLSGEYPEYALVAECSQTTDPRKYLTPGMRRLLETDRTQGTSLLRTLRAYLYSGRSLRMVAIRLHIHPNTVRYRVCKALEIIGDEHPDSRSFIRITAQIQILEYMDRELFF